MICDWTGNIEATVKALLFSAELRSWDGTWLKLFKHIILNLQGYLGGGISGENTPVKQNTKERERDCALEHDHRLGAESQSSSQLKTTPDEAEPKQAKDNG